MGGGRHPLHVFPDGVVGMPHCRVQQCAITDTRAEALSGLGLVRNALKNAFTILHKISSENDGGSFPTLYGTRVNNLKAGSNNNERTLSRPSTYGKSTSSRPAHRIHALCRLIISQEPYMGRLKMRIN